MMLSSAEIKKIALAIEEQMFAFFGDINTKYKSKYRSLTFNIKDPKNEVNCRYQFRHTFGKGRFIHSFVNSFIHSFSSVPKYYYHKYLSRVFLKWL